MGAGQRRICEARSVKKMSVCVCEHYIMCVLICFEFTCVIHIAIAQVCCKGLNICGGKCTNAHKANCEQKVGVYVI